MVINAREDCDNCDTSLYLSVYSPLSILYLKLTFPFTAPLLVENKENLFFNEIFFLRENMYIFESDSSDY